MMWTRRAFLLGTGASLVACATPPPPTATQATHPLEGLADFEGNNVEPPKILGAVTLIDFWASWCGPCRQAFRHLDQLYRTYEGDGLVMLGVSIDEDPKAAKRFWAAARPKFPVAWDAAGGIRERFSVTQLPTTMLFDDQGFVVDRNEGFDPADHRILEEHVHRLLRS
jgi:cytochrome c biogenesis protein CcmG, thiol:disulfide interchange protein DsbE